MSRLRPQPVDHRFGRQRRVAIRRHHRPPLAVTANGPGQPPSAVGHALTDAPGRRRGGFAHTRPIHAPRSSSAGHGLRRTSRRETIWMRQLRCWKGEPKPTISTARREVIAARPGSRTGRAGAVLGMSRHGAVTSAACRRDGLRVELGGASRHGPTKPAPLCDDHDR